jgi:hypothetical protein
LATNAKEKIQNSIREGVVCKRMFGSFSHDKVASQFGFFWTRPLGLVINADGKMRPINDLSYPKTENNIRSLNSFVKKLDFRTTWDVFKFVSQFFRDLRYLALFDWAKAYQQIPTRPSQWPFLMLKDLEGVLFLDTQIKFEGMAGCG